MSSSPKKEKRRSCCTRTSVFHFTKVRNQKEFRLPHFNIKPPNAVASARMHTTLFPLRQPLQKATLSAQTDLGWHRCPLQLALILRRCFPPLLFSAKEALVWERASVPPSRLSRLCPAPAPEVRFSVPYFHCFF
ncbi:hypothetical protein TRVL_06988 [Trypanosoma vivax]|nr:hypothetical protein TRVL_06988 [Trypanosoma vivax]